MHFIIVKLTTLSWQISSCIYQQQLKWYYIIHYCSSFIIQMPSKKVRTNQMTYLITFILLYCNSLFLSLITLFNLLIHAIISSMQSKTGVIIICLLHFSWMNIKKYDFNCCSKDSIALRFNLTICVVVQLPF